MITRKVVVVHRGARDSYQVARALRDAGMLEKLVTDLYWAPSHSAMGSLAKLLPAGILRQLQLRNEPGLLASQVEMCAASGLLSLALDKIRQSPFAWRRWATRRTDSQLGSTAGRLANNAQAALLSYSYYGYSAFQHFQSAAPSILFQLHPHPASMRRILLAELEAHPHCAASLSKEWELALPEQDYARLVEETQMARHCLAASSFTKQTMVEHGVAADRIEVIPYGVDLDRYRPSLESGTTGPLRLLFVGTINQRKGIHYLLEALRSFSERDVVLTVCGRVVDDLNMFRPFGTQVSVRPSVSHHELVRAYSSSNLFVFPSVAEGFGHVLLESLACGLPVLSTTHTAAPDLLEEGEDGFVIEPGRTDLIAERIRWAISNRVRLHNMRCAARRKAAQFSWQRFRLGVAAAVHRCFDRDECEHMYGPAAAPERKAVARV